MGRKKKQKDSTNIIGIIIICSIVAVYAKITFLKDFNPNFDFSKFNLFNRNQKIEVQKRSTVEDYTKVEQEKKIPQYKYYNIFFTKMSGNKNIYVAVSRKKKTDDKTSDTVFIIKQLLSGPNKSELQSGIYTEIPSSAKLISVKETSSKIIINLTNGFEDGDGGDSLYTRMYQLIKTINKNLSKPVYLYIDGKQANIIGGEGLMLKQPLRSNSLDD